jgi:hypothetical protein
MDYMQTVFQYYPANIKQTKPIGYISLLSYLNAIKHPKEEILAVFKKIELASLNGDLKEKARLKSNLYYFTPCIYSDGNGRTYENITSWTGLMVVDIDGLDKELAVEFKKYLFEKYKFFVAVFLSASKKGIKGIVRIPVCQSVDEFKSYFYGLMDEFQYYKGIDFSSKNCILANYLTYDEDLLYRIDAEVWDKKGIQLNEFKEAVDIKPLDNITQYDTKKCADIITKLIDKIVDNGHGQVVAAASLLGGMVGSQYINQTDAENLIKSLISSNNYLSKGTSGYIKTALTMIEKGKQSPILLNKHK